MEVRQARKSDFDSFKLHPANVEEIEAIEDITLEQEMSLLWELTTRKRAIEVNGKVVCLFGIFGENNTLWLFFSKDAEVPHSFFKVIKQEFEEFLKDNKYIQCNIYPKNRLALIMAKMCGLQYDGDVIVGTKGNTFFHYRKGVE